MGFNSFFKTYKQSVTSAYKEKAMVLSFLKNLNRFNSVLPARHSLSNLLTYCVLRHSNALTNGYKAYYSNNVKDTEENPEDDLKHLPTHLREQWKRKTFSYAGQNYENIDTTTIPQTVKEEHQDVFNPSLVRQMFDKMDGDMPLRDMPDPYTKGQRRCILCTYDIDVDFKNVKLLSQFVSPYSGRIYGRHITGLCIPMQKRVAKMIRRSRRFGFMPYIFKKPEYLNDPKLYNERLILK